MSSGNASTEWWEKWATYPIDDSYVDFEIENKNARHQWARHTASNQGINPTDANIESLGIVPWDTAANFARKYTLTKDPAVTNLLTAIFKYIKAMTLKGTLPLPPDLARALSEFDYTVRNLDAVRWKAANSSNMKFYTSGYDTLKHERRAKKKRDKAEKEAMFPSKFIKSNKW